MDYIVEIITGIIAFVSLLVSLNEMRLRLKKEKADIIRENDKYWFREVVLGRTLDKLDDLFIYIYSSIDSLLKNEMHKENAYNEFVNELYHIQRIIIPIIKATDDLLNKNIIDTLNDCEDLFQEFISNYVPQHPNLINYRSNQFKFPFESKKFELILRLYEYSKKEHL